MINFFVARSYTHYRAIFVIRNHILNVTNKLPTFDLRLDKGMIKSRG